MKKKISRDDRLMAIKRLPEFIKDYKAYNKLKLRESRYQKAYEIEEKWGEPIEAIINAEKLYERALPKSVKEVCSIYKDPMRLFCLGDGEGENVIEYFVEGERLYLEVDITDTRENLRREFGRVIKKFKEALPEDKGRNKKTTLDPWAIYDKHKKEGLSLSEIAKDISGVREESFDDEKHKAYYASVKRAFETAQKMLEQVKREVLGK